MKCNIYIFFFYQRFYLHTAIESVSPVWEISLRNGDPTSDPLLGTFTPDMDLLYKVPSAALQYGA